MRDRSQTTIRTTAFLLVVVAFALVGCSAVRQPSAVPASFIGVPVTEGADQTSDALRAAAHIPQDRFADARSVKDIPPAELIVTPIEELEVGDQDEFYINFDLDKDFRRIPATVKHLSPNAVWWVGDNTNISDENLRAAAENFENSALKIGRLIYGHEPAPGIDGYDPVHFLLVDMPQWGEFYGYFSTINQYPRAIQRFSNQKELLVINTAGQSLTSTAFASELAHEFGHLIMWSVDPNEDLWMNEGSSELASFFTASPAPGSVLDGGNEQVFANYPFIQLNARPDTSLPEFDRNVIFAHYAAEKLFMIYLLDRFGPQFIQDLFANPNAGIRALDQQLAKLDSPLTFNEVFADWLLANLMNQADHPQGHFGYSEVQTLLPSIITLSDFTGERLPGYMPPYSAFYYELHADEQVNVDFKGATMARLTPADPYEGHYAWYSNRGDESSFTLTREFDLRDARSATLNYRVWYELEQGYDYGYVLASGDGGETWDVLPTRHGMVENLSDDAYGIGYTGESGGWRKESLDLSKYAGQEVLVRFVTNSDLATNRSGMMFDNIEIPQIDFFDGAEDDAGQWDAQGFVRSANQVPVEWVVWIIKVNTDPEKADEVIRLPLDELQSADFDITGFGETFDFAAMVISPMAPTTTQSIDYEFALSGE